MSNCTILAHRKYKGKLQYLVEWRNRPINYSWENRKTMEKFENRIYEYEHADLTQLEERSAQTEGKIHNNFSRPRNFLDKPNYFINYTLHDVQIPNDTKPHKIPPKLSQDAILYKILGYLAESSEFCVVFADELDPQFVPAETLLAMYPKMIAEFFVEQEKNGDLF